jgi:hypothetical protein
MTFCKFTKAVKEILGIESLTEGQSKLMMTLYLTKTSVEDVAKKLKEEM